MPRRHGLPFSLAALAVAGVLALPVQAGRGDCAKGGGSYDRAAETTFAATVQEVATIECQCRAGASGTRLRVTSAEGTLAVQLGPSDFLASRNVTFATGDAIEVVGAPATCMGEEIVLARAVKKGDQTLTLRDEDGRPQWAGRGGGRGRRS